MSSARTPDTREQILLRLKTRGPQTTSELAEWLEVTVVAVRRHMVTLEEEGQIRREDRRGSVGRPCQVWELTDAGHRSFHDGHAELAVRLLQGVRQAFGDAGLEKLLDVMATADVKHAEARLSAVDTGARVEALAALRRDQGYMAEAAVDDLGGHLLIENHCPVDDAADHCDGLCDRELDLFQRLLGTGYDVARTEHIRDGDRRCVYRITERGEGRREADGDRQAIPV